MVEIGGGNSVGATEVGFTAIDDLLIEPTETIAVSITSAATIPATFVYFSTDPAVATIADNDALVVLISGHSQNGANNGSDETSAEDMANDCGFWLLADKIKAAGFAENNVLKFSEDPGNDKRDPLTTNANDAACHKNLDHIVGEVKVRIQNAKDQQNQPFTLNIAVIGYSHGGGLAWRVVNDLKDPQKNPHQNFRIFLTGYVDAIEAPLIDDENDLPLSTRYHVNYYQTEGTALQDTPKGGVTDPGPLVPGDTIFQENLDRNGDAIDHWGDNGIDRSGYVHDEIVKHIKRARQKVE